MPSGAASNDFCTQDHRVGDSAALCETAPVSDTQTTVALAVTTATSLRHFAIWRCVMPR
jgi:hypothetical protein